MNRLRCLALFMVAFCGTAMVWISGCSRHVTSFTVVLVDPSASITPRARAAEFAAVAALIPKLRRGDSLVVIPITNNAAANIEGRILRLHAPDRREPYDADLRRFRSDAGIRFAEFSHQLLRSPGARTDILGTLDVAAQEFDAAPQGARLVLVELSDFVEDDGIYRFSTAPELANPVNAKKFAVYLKRQRGFELHVAKVYLGALESDDLAHLAQERLDAIRQFWSIYISSSGQWNPIYLDGPGRLDVDFH